LVRILAIENNPRRSVCTNKSTPEMNQVRLNGQRSCRPDGGLLSMPSQSRSRCEAYAAPHVKVTRVAGKEARRVTHPVTTATTIVTTATAVTL
jgi:hypothetical protein